MVDMRVPMSDKEVMGMTAARRVTDERSELQELIENTLDLGRPELALIMERYVSHPGRPQMPLFRQPSALVVTRYDGQEMPVAEALETDGWSVKTCPGPGRTQCPVMRGEHCPLRESVDAAVVFVDARERGRQLGVVPRLRCAADSASPGVVALEGRLNNPRYEAGTAIVGAMRGPDVVLGAINALVGSASEDEESR